MQIEQRILMHQPRDVSRLYFIWRSVIGRDVYSLLRSISPAALLFSRTGRTTPGARNGQTAITSRDVYSRRPFCPYPRRMDTHRSTTDAKTFLFSSIVRPFPSLTCLTRPCFASFTPRRVIETNRFPPITARELFLRYFHYRFDYKRTEKKQREAVRTIRSYVRKLHETFPEAFSIRKFPLTGEREIKNTVYLNE